MSSSLSGQEALQQDDPEMWKLLTAEKTRQRNGLELIASEVIKFALQLKVFVVHV